MSKWILLQKQPRVTRVPPLQAMEYLKHDDVIGRGRNCKSSVLHDMASNCSPLLRMFSNTALGVSSLNGGIPVINSYKHTPRAHQSTPDPGNTNLKPL